MEKTECDNSVLALNAGSSSIKFAVFTADLTGTLSGIAANIEGAAFPAVAEKTGNSPFIDHKPALSKIITVLKSLVCDIKILKAATHRVVHCGRKLTAPVRITPEVRPEISNCTPLAPLQNQHSLAAIDALDHLIPKLPRFAGFDTSSYATKTYVPTRYTIPRIIETKGIGLHGFHGLYYASLVTNFTKVSSEKLPSRPLAFHLGNRASVCAINNGQSVATTMGYSPLDGLTMGTRSGGIDQMEGVDAIALASGIREKTLGVRARISRGLAWMGVRMNPDANDRIDVRLHAEGSKVKAWMIPAKEVKMIAAYASTLMGAR